MAELKELLTYLLGIGREDLDILQMTVRALVVYPLGIAMVHVGDKRFLGGIAAFDFLLAIIIGSILSRAISGSAPFVPSIAASFGLVLVHRGFAALGFRWRRFAKIVKGTPRELVREGEILWSEMKKSAIGEEDLLGAVRRHGGTTSLADVSAAFLERNGDISVVLRSLHRE
jgi:uncharacterized membrane protein YcaP (DUF421 family)